MQCSAQHQAVRHHTISTDGAARHAGCSGPTRPCVTARRRRQGSVGQVRECTGPAMPQHTYTQRAHNTHSPARLPVPVGRHPGLCHLVIAPSAHHTTPHHTTPHRTAPHRTAGSLRISSLCNHPATPLCHKPFPCVHFPSHSPSPLRGYAALCRTPIRHSCRSISHCARSPSRPHTHAPPILPWHTRNTLGTSVPQGA